MLGYKWIDLFPAQEDYQDSCLESKKTRNLTKILKSHWDDAFLYVNTMRWIYNMKMKIQDIMTGEKSFLQDQICLIRWRERSPHRSQNNWRSSGRPHCKVRQNSNSRRSARLLSRQYTLGFYLHQRSFGQCKPGKTHHVVPGAFCMQQNINDKVIIENKASSSKSYYTSETKWGHHGSILI